MTDPQHHQIVLEDGFSVTDRVQGTAREYFSINHIQSVALFTRQCAEIEARWAGRTAAVPNPRDRRQTARWQGALADLQSNAIAAIFAAQAFLEACVNEFVLDVRDMQRTPRQESEVGQTLPATVQQAILTKEEELLRKRRDAARNRMLVPEERFQEILKISGKQPFNETTSPYEDFALLRWFRNRLVHYEVASKLVIDTGAPLPPPGQMESELASRGFPLNPFPMTGLSRFLGHGCAVWAFTSVDQFAREFYTRMGVRVLYDHVQERLSIRK